MGIDERLAQIEVKKRQRAEILRTQGQAGLDAHDREEQAAKDEAKAQKARRENLNFTQVYPEGWKRLTDLMKEDRHAARLYAFFAEHMGPDGTVSASRTVLAEALDMSERTVSRHVKTLEKLKAVIVLKIGTANVYCLNPAEVWKSFDTAKPYAAFRTKTLVGKKENPFVKKRLTTILNGKVPEQASLPLGDVDLDWTADIPAPKELENEDLTTAMQRFAKR